MVWPAHVDHNRGTYHDRFHLADGPSIGTVVIDEWAVDLARLERAGIAFRHRRGGARMPDRRPCDRPREISTPPTQARLVRSSAASADRGSSMPRSSASRSATTSSTRDPPAVQMRAHCRQRPYFPTALFEACRSSSMISTAPSPGAPYHGGNKLLKELNYTPEVTRLQFLEARGCRLRDRRRDEHPELRLMPENAEPLAYGPTHNPWDTAPRPADRAADCSAVAAGLVPVACAGDGGGSIRIPASMCGLFGPEAVSGPACHSGPRSRNRGAGS